MKTAFFEVAIDEDADIDELCIKELLWNSLQFAVEKFRALHVEFY